MKGLTPWNTVILKKQRVAHLIYKKFIFYETRRFMPVLKTALNWTLS
jgi:hypothetical protein